MLGISVLCFDRVVQAGEVYAVVLGAKCMTLHVSGNNSRLISNFIAPHVSGALVVVSKAGGRCSVADLLKNQIAKGTGVPLWLYRVANETAHRISGTHSPTIKLAADYARTALAQCPMCTPLPMVGLA